MIYKAKLICTLLFTVLLFTDSSTRQVHECGALEPDCIVSEVVENAYTDAKFMCEQYYLNSPEMKLQVHNGLCFIYSLHNMPAPLGHGKVAMELVYIQFSLVYNRLLI